METSVHLNYEAEYNRLLAELEMAKQEITYLHEDLKNKEGELKYYLGFKTAIDIIFGGHNRHECYGKSSSEKRLIYADPIVDEFLKRYTKMERDGKLVFSACEIKRDFADVISEAPTVNAVEVVRCRECKHRGTDDCIFHIKGEPADEELLRNLDNDFCSYGERKDGDGNG